VRTLFLAWPWIFRILHLLPPTFPYNDPLDAGSHTAKRVDPGILSLTLHLRTQPVQVVTPRNRNLSNSASSKTVISFSITPLHPCRIAEEYRFKRSLRLYESLWYLG
jgi:hypothetical protein